MVDASSAYPSGCTLIGIKYSPWSYRARWGLDLKGVSYTYREYLPMLGEPLLRLQTGKLSGKLTVPVLIHGDLVLTDSLDILRHADRMGTEGPALFPAGHDGEVHRVWWLARDVLVAGRTRTTRRVLANRQALEENVPFKLPRPLRRTMVPLTIAGANYLLDKHGESTDDTTLEARMAEALEGLRQQLDGGEYFVGSGLTAADLAVVSALQFVKPMSERYIRLGKANAECWNEFRLAGAFEDLIAWRDDIVAKHR